MIELRHIEKRYSTGSAPLTDFSCTVNKGDVICVIGPSGTGKSTLLSCINLLSPPTAGEILLDGVRVNVPGYPLTKLRSRVGMVFQSFNLFNNLTVVSNCMVPAMELGGLSKQAAYDLAMKNLRRVGMEEFALRFPHELSGGQKQRAAIARTLTRGTEVILFDEPTSALDPISVKDVNRVIRDLAREGVTMIIVTHDMAFAEETANRVFYVDEGVLYEEGTPQEIFRHPKREKTRRFTQSMHTLSLVKQSTADYEEIMRELRDFSEPFRPDAVLRSRLNLLTEEIMFALFPEKARVECALEFDRRAGLLRVSACSSLPAAENEISRTLISGMAPDAVFGYDSVSLTLKL